MPSHRYTDTQIHGYRYLGHLTKGCCGEGGLLAVARGKDKVVPFWLYEGRQKKWNENKIIAFLLAAVVLFADFFSHFFFNAAASKPVSPQLGNKFD